MYLRRAGLACGLILLTACFVLSHAVPAKQGGRPSSTGSSVTKSEQKPPTGKDDGPTKDVSTTEPPTELSTPRTTSLEDKDKDEIATTTAVPSVSPSEPSESKVTKVDLEFLYFQIRQCISKRNLTLDDIQDVLSQKDDEYQFMYTLAFKLGYIVNGKHDNPHIPVIMSHREKLIMLLEEAAAKLSEPPSQEREEEPAELDPDDKPPADNELIFSHKIGYEVTKAMCALGPDAIHTLLSNPSFSDALGYTVGVELGYSPVDVHMKYLENADAAELKRLLQQILKLKKSACKQYLEEMPNKLNEQEPTVSNESPTSNEPSPTSDSSTISYEVANAIRELGSDAIYDLLNDPSFSDTLGYTVGVELGYSPVDVHMKYLENADVAELKEFLQQTLESKTPASKNNLEGFGTESVDKSEQNFSPNYKLGVSEYSQTTEPSALASAPQGETESDGDIDSKNGAEWTPTGVRIHVGGRQGDDGEQSQQPTTKGESMEVYNEWEVESWELHVETPGQIIDDEAQTEDKADDSSNSFKDNTYRPDHSADDYWKLPAYHRYPTSGVGLRDYIMLCLLIGIAVGIGYLCACSKKKAAPVRIVTIERSDMKSKFSMPI